MTLQENGGVGAVPDVGTSFDDFYAAHFRGLTIQLFAYTNDLGHAQDVVQEAFCRALARWSRISGYDEPVAWVRRVAMNLATNRFRRAKVALGFLRKQREEHVEGPSPDRVAIAAALATLPTAHRRAVILHHLADLPIAEIALQEGVAEGTVKSWLHRGRAALATQLKEKRDV